MIGWIPYKLVPDNGQQLCRWLQIHDTPFSDPFFADTISKCMSHGLRYHSVSTVNLLPAWANDIDAVEPSAFIFHISRCGSTLLSQLLDVSPQHIVLPEVPFFDELLRGGIPALKPAIQFYGQKRTGAETHLFIKTDSWHVCFYKTLRELYPSVPFILLYRHPQEVLRSQPKKRGMHAVPGVIAAEIFGFDAEPVTDLDVYMSKVLERYLSLFEEIIHTDERSLLVNYNQGMMNVAEAVARFTGVELGEEDRKKMETRCRYNAKYPDQVFSEAAIDSAPPAYLQQSMELYHRLEQMRTL